MDPDFNYQASSAQPKQQMAKKRRSRVKIGLLILGAATLVAAAAVMHSYSNAPNLGVVAPSNQAEAAESKPADQVLESKYFSLAYPATYSLRENPQKSPDNLGAWTFLASGSNYSTGTRQIGITLKKLPPGGLTQESSYLLYKNFPTKYKLSQQMLKGEPVAVATKTEGDEHAAMWVHKSYLLIISAVNTNLPATGGNDFNTILDSVQWLL